jgi:hypothetical protein
MLSRRCAIASMLHGWIVDQVIKEDRSAEIVERARTALISRGWKP